ncbi:MAG: hypothetical protein EOP45_11005 [Sphingobacteriaceae bacterium]|nr:MAG: hypothetical protein EOP45_11005 [Sphingobacteriaceae bacterium]
MYYLFNARDTLMINDAFTIFMTTNELILTIDDLGSIGQIHQAFDQTYHMSIFSRFIVIQVQIDESSVTQPTLLQQQT